MIWCFTDFQVKYISLGNFLKIPCKKQYLTTYLYSIYMYNMHYEVGLIIFYFNFYSRATMQIEENFPAYENCTLITGLSH